MKKIKVLHMPVTNSGSGVTQYILQNWKFINKSRFRFDFATRSKNLDFADEFIAEGCKIHYLSCSSEEDEEQFIKEVHQILDEGYDAIHLHTSFWKGFLVEKIAVERKCPIIIVHSHSTMVDVLDDAKRNEYINKHNFYKNTFPLEYATNFCACSNDAAEWLFGEQIPKNQIKILKNAIDIEKYSFSAEARARYRKELKLDGCFVLGHVGRFSYTKNHNMLIEIFHEVHKHIPNAKLMLIGGGELELTIKKKVIDYGLENDVLFLGKRQDVPLLLQAMDVFLLPSLFEGLGLVLIEAQAVGLKCFASEGLPMEVKITPNLEVIPNSISAWVQSILQVADGYERIKNDDIIKKAGYDLKTQIKVIEKLYSGEDIF